LLSGVGDPDQRVLDGAGALPSPGFPQPVEMPKGPVGQSAQGLLVQHRQFGGSAGAVQNDGGGNAIARVRFAKRGAEVFQQHAEPATRDRGSDHFRHGDTMPGGEPERLFLAGERLGGVLVDGGGAVGEGEAFHTGHRPDPYSLSLREGQSSGLAEIGEQVFGGCHRRSVPRSGTLTTFLIERTSSSISSAPSSRAESSRRPIGTPQDQYQRSRPCASGLQVTLSLRWLFAPRTRISAPYCSASSPAA
jgi:hypothetical protein